MRWYYIGDMIQFDTDVVKAYFVANGAQYLAYTHRNVVQIPDMPTGIYRLFVATKCGEREYMIGIQSSRPIHMLPKLENHRHKYHIVNCDTWHVPHCAPKCQCDFHHNHPGYPHHIPKRDLCNCNHHHVREFHCHEHLDHCHKHYDEHHGHHAHDLMETIAVLRELGVLPEKQSQDDNG